jgi:hypothetical protein
MAEPVLKKAITKIVEISSKGKEQPTKNAEYTMPDLVDDIKKHIDRRFLELVDKQNYTERDIKAQKSNVHIPYTVPIYLNILGLKSKQFLEINPEDTVQTIYNNIYFMLEDKVPAFTYLEKWILRERKTGIHLVTAHWRKLNTKRANG